MSSSSPFQSGQLWGFIRSRGKTVPRTTYLIISMFFHYAIMLKELGGRMKTHFHFAKPHLHFPLSHPIHPLVSWKKRLWEHACKFHQKNPLLQSGGMFANRSINHEHFKVHLCKLYYNPFRTGVKKKCIERVKIRTCMQTVPGQSALWTWLFLRGGAQTIQREPIRKHHVSAATHTLGQSTLTYVMYEIRFHIGFLCTCHCPKF